MQSDRLRQERIKWRQKHPFAFWAKPKMTEDGTTNLSEWEAAIPGPKNSPWEGGLFNMRICFPDEYPTKAPRLFFNPPLFHPNIYPSGEVCSSMLTSDWHASFSIADLLLATQHLLANPHPSHPAQAEPFQLFTLDRDAYEARVREMAIAQASKPKDQLPDDEETAIKRYLGPDFVLDENGYNSNNSQVTNAISAKKALPVITIDENSEENGPVVH